jgi:hypothetical protein
MLENYRVTIVGCWKTSDYRYSEVELFGVVVLELPNIVSRELKNMRVTIVGCWKSSDYRYSDVGNHPTIVTRMIKIIRVTMFGCSPTRVPSYDGRDHRIKNNIEWQCPINKAKKGAA